MLKKIHTIAPEMAFSPSLLSFDYHDYIVIEFETVIDF